MRFLTDRKRAEGKGASGHGTGHHWYMQMSAVGLAFLVPTFVILLGTLIGKDRADVQEAFSHPFMAILTALTLVISMRHFAKGADLWIDDYLRGTTRKMMVIFITSLSYVITAVGLFALAKIAL
jgi:succinate dehydrogenase / fumarate reductase membrane anchor subunit